MSKACHALSETEAAQMQQIAEVSQVVMEEGVARLVAEAAMSSMPFETSVDGTSGVVFKHHSMRSPSGKVVHRKAKQTEAFLVRIQFVLCTLARWACGNARCHPRPCAFETREMVPMPLWKSSGVIGRLGDSWTMLGAQWNRSCSIGLRCQLRSASGGWCVLPTCHADAPCHDGLSPGPQTSSF